MKKFKIFIPILILFFSLNCEDPITKPVIIGLVKNITHDKVEIRLHYNYFKFLGDNRLQELLEESVESGKRLYMIKPGYKIVEVEIEKTDLKDKHLAKARVVSGEADDLRIGEKVFPDLNIINANKARYDKLMQTVSGSEISDETARSIIKKSEILIKKDQIWKGVEMLLKVKKTKTVLQEIRAEACFKMAMAFNAEFTRYRRSEIRELNDLINAREILLRMVKDFKINSIWIDRAYYNLGNQYDHIIWQGKNSILYEYMKKAGVLGDIFFNYGRNILKTMADDSILITEGGDNQVFSLQILTQIEKQRPDIAIYDQKGHIFDQIYGEIIKLNRRQLRKNQIEADKILIMKKRAPDWTVIRSFRSKKEVFRKKNGQVYYTWKDNQRLKSINNYLKASDQPTYHYEQMGILFQIVPDGETASGPYTKDEIWNRYKMDYDEGKIKNFPYMIREILANYKFQHGDHYMRKAQNAYNNDDMDQYEKYHGLAYEKYRQSIDYAFDMTAIHFNYSLLLEQMIKFLKKEEDLSKILSILDEARDHYLKAAQIETERSQIDARCYLNAGKTYEKKAEYDKKNEIKYWKRALKCYEKAQEANPDNKKVEESIKRINKNLIKDMF
jgi:hypothetical protein